MIRAIALFAALFAGLTALAADDPQTDPKKEAVDVGKTAERIVQNAHEAGKRLGAKDPGADTRKIQQEILKDIDALIRKAQEPPPPDQNQEPKGGMNDMDSGMSKKSMGGNDTTGSRPPSRKERRERAKQNAGNSAGSPQQRNQSASASTRPDPKTGVGPMDTSPNRIESKAAMPRIPDVYKEVWGHLPEKMRQEMDLYFRDRFMPRYSELLRQYYSSLAERGVKTGP